MKAIGNTGYPFLKMDFENPMFIKRHGRAKSASPFGNFNDAMHMVRQHHPSVYLEWMGPLYLSHHAPKRTDITHEQIIAPPLKQIDSKKIGTARIPVATIIGH